MRISYNNLLKNSTIVATNEVANYPATNLYHVWKKKLFKASATTTQITVTFSEISSISSVCLAEHNLTECTVEFYDTTDTLIDTWTLDTSFKFEAVYGDISDCKKAIVNATSLSNVEIGLIYIGDSIYSGIEAENSIPLSSNDNVLASTDRQISGKRGSSTREASVTIPMLSSDERKEIEACYYSCGLIIPFILDLWNSSHSEFEPVYCVFTSNLDVTHPASGDKVSFSIKGAN